MSFSSVQTDPNVIDTEIDGEMILLHLGKRRYYSLNPTGARIWSLLKQEHTIERIVEIISKEWDIPKDDAYTHVVSLLQNLKAEGLVKETLG